MSKKNEENKNIVVRFSLIDEPYGIEFNIHCQEAKENKVKKYGSWIMDHCDDIGSDFIFMVRMLVASEFKMNPPLNKEDSNYVVNLSYDQLTKLSQLLFDRYVWRAQKVKF